MNPLLEFLAQGREEVARQSEDNSFCKATSDWMLASLRHHYSYHFTWLGRPAIQYPTDAWALQELIWLIRPDLIIETGIAHGGSLMFSASMLALLEMCEAAERGETLDPRAPRRKVLGIDIDIRAHNRQAIEAHPMASRIQMIEGSSIAPDVIDQVREIASRHQRVLVCLDSNHTHEHVLAELEAYAPLVSSGSYCIVFDTIVEDMPASCFPDRPWGPGNNPKTAVRAFLERQEAQPRLGADGSSLRFEIDRTIPDKLLITVAPDGFLRRA